MPDPIAPAVARPRTVRATMLFATIFVAIFTLSLSTAAAASSPLTTPAAQAQASQLLALSATSAPTTPRTATAAAPKRAVIVVGPVASQTNEYIGYAKAIAAALNVAGVSVDLIIPPHATWRNVKAVADGADFFAYIGHGNGWPSPYSSNGEESHDGLGLNPTDGDTNYSHVKYFGSNYLRGGYHCTLGVPSPDTQAACSRVNGQWKDYGSGIQLASDAIVVLNHLCFASGNGEPGMAIPTQSVAFQRADNHANGWLAAGAKVVFSLSWQPGEDIVNWLRTKHLSMEGLFELRDSAGSPSPFRGWVGSDPNVYMPSARTPGATVHLDPDLDPAHRNGYLRAVTGDLSFTTDEWWGSTGGGGGGGGGGGDTTPPVISGLTAQQNASIIPADANGPTIFTPNGDGISDTVTFHHSLSEPASLAFTITARGGTTVDRFTNDSFAGDSTDTWDGKAADGTVVPDGTYTVTVVPTDASGNVGDAASTRVTSLTTMKSLTLSPNLINPADGDALAQTSTQSLRLTADATLSWVITDRNGSVIKTALSSQAVSAGPVSWDWDGTDDSGHFVPNGIYWSVVTARTDAGTYSQWLPVRVMPFKISAKATTVRAGQTVKLSITAAEPQLGRPAVTVTQTGLAARKVAVKQNSTTKFTVSFTVKAGGTAGPITITIVGTDANGGVDTQTFIVTRK